MHAQTSNIVRVCLKLYNLLASVEIETSKHKVIATTNEPIFPGDEFTSSNWDICDLKGLYDRRGLVIVEQDLTIVHRG